MAVQTPRAEPRLICPLDAPNRSQAESMIARIGDAIGFYKIGLELLATDGMALAADLRRQGLRTFLDWKLHDIGETVKRATAAITATGACDFLTVHAEPQVMAAAVQGRGSDPQVKILGVTVLTSLDEDDLTTLGYSLSVRDLVARRIGQALDSGVDGVVASPHEAALAHEIASAANRPDFLVVTPGVRPSWAAKNDQARAATPLEARRAGATHLVCGRPITSADDPRRAALAISAEMAAA